MGLQVYLHETVVSQIMFITYADSGERQYAGNGRSNITTPSAAIIAQKARYLVFFITLTCKGSQDK